MSNDGLGNYRAIVAELDFNAEGCVALSPDMLAALDITDGEPIRVIAL